MENKRGSCIFCMSFAHAVSSATRIIISTQLSSQGKNWNPHSLPENLGRRDVLPSSLSPTTTPSCLILQRKLQLANPLPKAQKEGVRKNGYREVVNKFAVKDEQPPPDIR